MVRLGGQIIKEMITCIILKKLIELVYSRHDMVPLDNLKFIAVIQDTGLIYKSLILQLRHRRENLKKRPGFRPEHSRSGQHQY